MGKNCVSQILVLAIQLLTLLLNVFKELDKEQDLLQSFCR